MNMSLYELTEEIAMAEKEVELWAEEHEGDITDCPFEAILGDLGDAKESKALNVGIWYKNLLSDSEAIKKEMQSLKYRKRVLDNSAQRIKNYLQDNLGEGVKIKGSKCEISWRKNTAVEIPETITPEELKELFPNLTKTEVEFRKKDIGTEIKAGGLTMKKETPSGDVEIPYMEIEKVDGTKVKFCIPQHKNIQVK